MSATTAKPGFFRNAFKAIVDCKQREAARYVNGMLLSFDDETLTRHGYSRAELSKQATTSPYWY